MAKEGEIVENMTINESLPIAELVEQQKDKKVFVPYETDLTRVEA